MLIFRLEESCYFQSECPGESSALIYKHATPIAFTMRLLLPRYSQRAPYHYLQWAQNQALGAVLKAKFGPLLL